MPRCRCCAALVVVLATIRVGAAQPHDWPPPAPVPESAADGSLIVTDEWDAPVPGVPGRYYLDSGPGPIRTRPWQTGDAPYLPETQPWADAGEPPPTYCSWLTRLGFRHSYTHGRNVGWGGPLVGTSWLNRPYYVGGTLGPMWMTRSVENSVARDVDAIGSVLIGWDWDYYWGTELQYAYATPELINSAARDAQRNDRLVHWNYSLMYYPWGDAEIRPFWRLGVGDTKFDFPRDDGVRWDEWLLTFPVGVGVKYPVRRWLAARAELTDYISWGGHGVASQHNLALTFGLEYRFGAHQKSYWPWYPSRHMR